MKKLKLKFHLNTAVQKNFFPYCVIKNYNKVQI